MFACLANKLYMMNSNQQILSVSTLQLYYIRTSIELLLFTAHLKMYYLLS